MWYWALKWFPNVFLNLYFGLPLTHAFVYRFCDTSREPMIFSPRYCKLCQYEMCACPPYETSQQLGSQCAYVAQKCFSRVLRSQSRRLSPLLTKCWADLRLNFENHKGMDSLFEATFSFWIETQIQFYNPFKRDVLSGYIALYDFHTPPKVGIPWRWIASLQPP